MAETVMTDGTDGRRILGILAVVFAILFVGGFIVGMDTPDYDAADGKWTSWFADEDNQTAAVGGIVAATLSSLVLVWFSALVASTLRSRLPDEGIPMLVLASGITAGVTLGIGRVIASSMGAALALAPDFDVVPSAELLRSVEQIGIGVMLMVGGWSAALFVTALAAAARRSALLPAWLGTTGYVVGGLLLLSVFFLPLLLLPLYMLVAGVILFTSSDRAEAT